MDKEIIIVSVGGSLIVPEEVDVAFLKKFKELILEFVGKDKRFLLISGGGKICRKYQNAAKELADLNKTDLDWLGIASTKFNAYLLKTIFKGDVYDGVIDDPTEKINFKEDVMVAGGWKPGCSTDFDAVLLAENFGIKKIVNLTNIEYVYDKDPNKFDDAKPIKAINWADFRKIVGDDWDPGLNAPFDPIASKKCEELGIEVAIIKGSDIDNFRDYLEGKEFTGTKIAP